MKRVDFLDLAGEGKCYDVVLEATTGEHFKARIRATDAVAASLKASNGFQKDTGIVTHALSADVTDWEGLVDRYFAKQSTPTPGAE